MTFLDAQLVYLRACRAYATEGTELARRAMVEAARLVDQVFRSQFPSAAAR